MSGPRGRLRRRSALPLPRYTLRKSLAGGWAYYFNPPMWAREPDGDRGQCPVGNEALGTDYDAAVRRVEGVLLPLFDSWRTRGIVDLVPAAGAQRGTLDWMFTVYRDTDRFKALRPKVKRLYQQGFDIVGNHILKDGRRLGDVKLTAISAAIVDKLYKILLPRRDDKGNPLPLFKDGSLTDENGEPLYVERRTSVNNAMKYCRVAWNVVHRLHRNDIPSDNPFVGMRLSSRTRQVEAATYADLLAAVAQADAMRLPSLGTALMVTWHWLQREAHIFTAFRLEHYRPKKDPNRVFIADPKTGEDKWYPLFNEAGVPLVPELMARMDAAKRNRVGNGLFFMRDWIDKKTGVPLPWATPGGQMRMVGTKLREVLDACGIDKSITFTSFRHGGMTDLGDAGLTDAEIRAVSRHRSSKVLPRYVKETDKQYIEAIEKLNAKRRADRPAQPADNKQLELFAGGQAVTKGGAT